MVTFGNGMFWKLWTTMSWCHHVLSVVNLVNLVPQAYSPLAKGKLAKDPLCSKIGEAHGKSAVQVRSGKLFSEQIWTRPVVSTRYALCLVWCKTTSEPSFNYCVMLNSLVGGSEHFWFFHILGMSSSQLTNSIIFQRGRAQPPASFDCSFLGLGPMFFGDTRATGCLPIGWWPADLIDQRSFVYENRNRMGTSPLNRALESFARRK